MDLVQNWEEIRKVFDSARQSSLHFSLATVDSEGNPHVTPIGSLILRDDCTGFYFEEFPIGLPQNLGKNRKVAVLALNSDPTFWLESLSGGRFAAFPGMRLMGTVQEKREASKEEIEAWQQRVSFAKGLKGHDILWKNMKTVRDIEFDDFKPVLCGEMTDHLHPRM